MKPSPTVGTPPRATLVHAFDAHDFWGLPDEALDTDGFFDALEVAWPGWNVVHWHGYVTEQFGAHVAVVLTRMDGTEGWAVTIVRLGGRDVRMSLEAWHTWDYMTKFETIGRFFRHSVVRADSDFNSFGAYLSTRVTGNLGVEQVDNHLFYRPWMWRAVYDTPDTAVPDVDAVRFLWALGGMHAPTV